MKRFASDHYDAIEPKGRYRLMIHHDDTIEGVRQDIDDSNERAIAKGYSGSAYIITHKEWYTYYDDDGHFVKSEHYEQAVEMYPPESEV